MRVSLYSGHSWWVMVPAKHNRPLATVTECGTLIFESTIPSILVSDEAWTRFRTDITGRVFPGQRRRGLQLTDECMERYGTLGVLCEGAPRRIFLRRGLVDAMAPHPFG